jgi:cytochrome c oxidase subunit 2
LILDPHHTPRRRALILVTLAALAALLVFAAGAGADAITPESGAGSGNADSIDTLYKFLLALAVVVFVGVEGALLYSLFKFRSRKGLEAAQIRGNTNLEIGWTVGAALLLVVITVVTFIKLPDIKNPPRSDATGLSAGGNLYASTDQPEPPGGKALKVQVNGQQYIWRFTYPNGVFAYDTMYVPLNTTVTLDVTAQDVAHSWWIPALGGKADGVPGYVNKTWFKITKAGTYEGQCAELCGRGHANMVARVTALPVDQYNAWLTRKKKEIDDANAAAAKESKQRQSATAGASGTGSTDAATTTAPPGAAK